MTPFGTIEGTGFEVIEPEFAACLAKPERVARLWTGARWSEGPAWFAAHGTLVWSDIPNNRMLRYDERNDSVGIFRTASTKHFISFSFLGNSGESTFKATTCCVLRSTARNTTP